MTTMSLFEHLEHVRQGARVILREKRTPSPYQQAILDDLLTGTPAITVNATAGSGKTSLLEMIADTIEAHDLVPADEKVGFLAFNQHIVKELKKRIPKTFDIRTVSSLGHLICKEQMPNLTFEPRKYEDLAREIVRECGVPSPAARRELQDRLDACLNLHVGHDLGLQINLPAWAEAMDAVDAPILGAEEALHRLTLRVLRHGLKLLQDQQVMSFTDQVLAPMTFGWRLGTPYRFLLVDELQDLSRAQLGLLQAATDEQSRIVGVGDAHQCQPSDTQVAVVRSGGNRWHPRIIENIPITEVEVGDRMISWRASDGGYRFCDTVEAICQRPYGGDLIRVTTECGKTSRYTPEHLCLTNFASLRDHYSVYLMRKGNRFRISVACLSYHRSSGPFLRAQVEKADALWILKVYPSKSEAILAEATYGAIYGIPEMIFNPTGMNTTHFTPEAVEAAWQRVESTVNLRERGERLLRDCGRDPQLPLWTAESKYSTLKRPIITSAANLIDGILVLPFNNGAGKTIPDIWVSVTVSRETCQGKVYSLQVSGEHFYTADGILTHNCLYAFNGADADSMAQFTQVFRAVTRPLSITYRCPTRHVALARPYTDAIEAAPGAPFGSLDDLTGEDFLDLARPGDLALCRTNAPLIDWCYRLVTQGTPAIVRGRDLAKNLVAFARDAATFDGVKPHRDRVKDSLPLDDITKQLNAYADFLASKASRDAEREGKDPGLRIAGIADRLAALLRVLEAGEARTLGDLTQNIRLLFQGDPERSVVLSTVHRAKGLEAERVFILEPQLLPHPKAQSAQALDAERCLQFVAFTRSKRELYFVDAPESRIPDEWRGRT